MERWKAALTALIFITSALLIFGQVSGEEPVTRSGNDLYVSPSGSTYNEVQWALDNATQGDTIYVAPGNYSQGMRITKSGISVIGNSTDGDVRISNSDMFVAGVQGSWINISNVNITTDDGMFGLLALTYSDNATLDNVIIHSDTSTPGLIINFCTDLLVKDLNVNTRDGLPVDVKMSSNITFEGFHLITDEFEFGFLSENVVTDLVLRDGHIEMGDPIAAALAMGGNASASIFNVTSIGGELYLVNKEGTVDIMDTFVEKDRINGTDPAGKVNVWFHRDIHISYLNRVGKELPAALADLKFNVNGEDVYATGRYLGWDLRSNAQGMFNEPFKFLSVYCHGEDPPKYGENTVTAWYGNDMEQEIVLENVDANTTEPLMVLFDEISRTNGTLEGKVGYNGGPLGTQMAPNATLELIHPVLDLIVSTKTDANGSFYIEELPFNDNYTIKLIPPNAVDPEGNVSGYTVTLWEYQFNEDRNITLWIEYYQYIPPTNGSISGKVTYSGGPLDGTNATNATVFLLDLDMIEIGNMTVDATGMYLFEEIQFAENYTLRIVPEDGVVSGGLIDGYPTIEMVFHHMEDDVMDIGINYYIYIEATSGPIFGWIRYQEGPNDGMFASNATVELLNLTGVSLGTTASDNEGRFLFEDVPFGVGYELRISPHADVIGINNQITGYLFWDGSAFPHNGSTSMNATLKYYEYKEPEVHPKVTLELENGDPAVNFTVKATIGGEAYTAVTDALGNAVFTGYDGEEFPHGTEYEASKAGWNKKKWTQGDAVPAMKKAEEYDNNIIFIIIAALFIIITSAVLILLFVVRTKEEIIEE